MAWVDKSPHILLRRKYQCSDCRYIWEERVADSSAPAPPCPACAAQKAAYQPPMPALGTAKGKAIDIAQQMAEQDYGLTNMRDNQRQGDIAAMGPAPIQTAEREKQIRELVEAGMPAELADPNLEKQVQSYWQGQMIQDQPGGSPGSLQEASSSAAKAAMSVAKAEGVDALTLLEEGRKQGTAPMRFNVVSAADAPELRELKKPAGAP